MRKNVVVVLLSLVCVSSQARAHEGHGDPVHSAGPLHYLVNPSHLAEGLCLIALVAAVIVGARWARQSKS